MRSSCELGLKDINAFKGSINPPFIGGSRAYGIRAFIWCVLQEFKDFPVISNDIKLSIREKTDLDFPNSVIGKNIKYWYELGFLRREKLNNDPCFSYTPTARFWSYIRNEEELKKCCEYYKYSKDLNKTHCIACGKMF